MGFEEAYVDGNIVSAAAWPAQPKLLAKYIEILGTTILHSWILNELLRF